MTPDTLDYITRVANGMVKAATMVREDMNAVLLTNDHVQVIKHYDALRKVNDQIKTAREALSDMADLLSKEKIPDIVRDLKNRTGEKPPFHIEGVGRVSVAHKYSCSMLDKEAGFQWLRDKGHEGLIQETVNSSTLSAFAKNMLEEEGVELPDNIFKTGYMPYTSITKK